MSAGPSDPWSASGPKVFITYRREETAIHAGRLYDAMVVRFGEGNVFMDVDMAPGVDFVERITAAVAACEVLIVVMGPRWATVENEEGTVRLADPEDFVRLEVEAALRRPEVTPIPVLVAGAKMPGREELPQELRAITRRNALELSDLRWRQDVGRLISTLDGLLAETRPGPGLPSPERGTDTEEAAPADAARAPWKAAAPPTATPTTPLKTKPAPLWTRIGRRKRWALLGTLAIAAIVIAIVVAAGGGGGGGSSSFTPSPQTQFTAADLHKLVLPYTPPPASNLGFSNELSGGGQGALRRLTNGLNLPVKKLPSALGAEAAYNNYWDALDPGKQPHAADSLAVVFKNETVAQRAFANLQADLEKGNGVKPAMPGSSGGPERFDWGVGGDSLGVLRNASTAPAYEYLWRTGNLLQDFELDSTSPDTPVTQDIATSNATAMRCLIPRQCE